MVSQSHAVDTTGVVIDEPPERGIYRHPSDFLRLLLAVGLTLAGLLLAWLLDDVSRVIVVEVIEAVGRVPSPIVVSVTLFIGLLGILLPILAIAYFIRHGQWRRLAIAVTASVAALAVMWGIEAILVDSFSPSDLPYTPPSWLCPPAADGAEFATFDCLPVASIDTPLERYGHIVALTAFFAAIYPFLNRRWKQFGWVLLFVAATMRLIELLSPPIDAFLAIGIAFSVGTAALLVFGEPDRRPRGRRVVEGLARGGVPLSTLSRASVDARGSIPWFATSQSGDELFVKVLTPDERAADILFRWYRILRLKGVGDDRPATSLKRTVEREAVASLKASSDGIRTPRLVALAEVVPSSWVMAYERIRGDSLDAVDPDDMTDEVLHKVWELVAELRSHRTAHRDLRLANVFLAEDGEPWLIDFGFSELAATDVQLRSDVAELLTSTASVVGPERAVASAISALGPEPVADAASRIQPLALSGATRDALKKQKGLAEQIRDEIATQTGAEPVALEKLERLQTRTIVMILGFAAAMYLLIPQLTQTDFGAVLDANWAWLPAILVASFLTYVGAALSIMGSVPDRIPLIPAILTQLAGSFINRITPVKVGGLATNVRFLQKNGVELTSAVAGLGVSSVSTFVVHISLLLMALFFLGTNAGAFMSFPSGTAVLVGMVVIFLLAGVVYLLPPARRVFMANVWPAIRKSGAGLAAVAQTPSKAMLLFGGALLLISAYIAALGFSIAAFGGGLGLAAVAVVFLGGQAVGNLAPTPGGIGSAEAAIIAAMTALGLDATTAVSATFLYRIATFWLPIIPGFLALRYLEGNDQL